MNSIDWGIIISLYLIPTFIALLRHHHNVSGVFLVNLLVAKRIRVSPSVCGRRAKPGRACPSILDGPVTTPAAP